MSNNPDNGFTKIGVPAGVAIIACALLSLFVTVPRLHMGLLCLAIFCVIEGIGHIRKWWT